MRCLSDEQIARLADAAGDFEGRGALEAHADACAACRQRLRAVRHAATTSATALSPGPSRSFGTPVAGDPRPRTSEATGARPAFEIPGYEIVRELHRGGQGIVYLAVQRSTRREVAIKVLREGPLATAGDSARFEREVELLAQLDHPNIVTVFDRGTVGPWQYFVMKYVPGQTLDRWAATARPLVERLRLFERLCRAVQAAHIRGVVHRDLKPSNVRVDEQGEPHVLDFGLAKAIQTETTLGSPTLTVTGQFMGSLPWASPEHAAAVPARIDARSDVYSLGVMLFQLLTGQLPYDVSSNLRAAIDRILYTTPRAPSIVLNERSGEPRAGIDRELDTITLKCLRKEPERRYADAGAVAADVARYLAGEPIAARRESLAYRIRKRVAHFARTQPVVVLALLAAVAWITAENVGTPLAFHWTPAQALFHSFALGGMPRTTTMPLSRVRIVEIQREADLAALSRAAGVEPACTADEPRCLRRIHGRFLERLAQAGPQVVAFDTRFAGASPYDDDLVRGLDALRAAGVPVVLATDTWSDDPELFPGVEPAIAGKAVVASNPGGFQPNNWEYYLAVDKRAVMPRPSLALAIFAATLQPRAALSLRLDWASKALTLLFQDAANAEPRSRPTSGGVTRLRVSAIGAPGPGGADLGLEPDDVVAYYYLDIPDDAAIAAARIDYARALSVDLESLRSGVGGRIVLIADARPDDNYAGTPDGRTLCRTYAHALAVDQLLRDAPIRIPAPGTVSLLTVLSVLAGLGLGWWLAQNAAGRAVAYGLAAALITGICVLAAWSLKFLYPPLVALVGVVVAAELAAVARRLGGAPAGLRG